VLVIFNDAIASRRLVFCEPRAVITAYSAVQVKQALSAISRAQLQGCHVAGWFAYELGYALEAKLAPRLDPKREQPLLKFGVYDGRYKDPPAILGRAYAGPLQPDWAQSGYNTAFERIHGYIAAGDIYQANLSFRARFAFVGDPYALYNSLLAQSGAAHCAYLDDGERQILSLSPELFFNLSADGTITARPMKGTAPRQGLDGPARAVLATSPKNRAENLMIVDLIRNDLGRIAEVGSVKVQDLFEVQTYPTFHTMVSTVIAHKRNDAGIAEIVRALFPCGSVTGTPKIRAMEILHDLESSPRDIYCGAIGHFDPDGSASFNVAIRTMTITASNGQLGIGGAIVQDSTAASEYAECLLKARFFEIFRKKIELIETLRFEDGFVRLTSHLSRMQNSASLFGLAFQDKIAREALDRAVSGEARTLRVRLTLDEAGHYDVSTSPLSQNPPHWTYKVSKERVQSTDLLLRHKTNWRELYDGEVARLGSDEVVFLNERGEVTEGARSNIFVERDGMLLTPPLNAGVLDGRLRAELLGQGKAREASLFPSDLVEGVFFGNSLRGLIAGVRG
jgi:para-aminobenzoate synthetase/4-amino-4-deoxychorismate lyase